LHPVGAAQKLGVCLDARQNGRLAERSFDDPRESRRHPVVMTDRAWRIRGRAGIGAARCRASRVANGSAARPRRSRRVAHCS
jgi:hypothetical protein